MARLIHRHLSPTLPASRTIDVGRILLLLLQFAIIGGVGLFIVLTIVNTILGTGQPDAVYSPYS